MKKNFKNLTGAVFLLIVFIIDFLIITKHFGWVDKLNVVFFTLLTICMVWYIIELKYE